MEKSIRLSFLATIFLLISCSTQQHIDGNYSFETECMGVKMDGSQTLKVWGAGRNKSEAIEQAKKNAIRDVLFKGIRKGKNDCNLKPILVEVNAFENNESYFNLFFAENGPYNEFINGDDSKSRFTVFKGRNNNEYETYAIIVDVQRSKLKEKLINDSIIK